VTRFSDGGYIVNDQLVQQRQKRSLNLQTVQTLLPHRNEAPPLFVRHKLDALKLRYGTLAVAIAQGGKL